MYTATTQREDFIPGSEAARVFGYTSDYIAKLAREKKISAKRVGKAWHVSMESLSAFKERIEVEKRERNEQIRQERLREQSVASRQMAQSVPQQSIPTPFVIPTRNRVKYPSKHKAAFQTALIVFIGLVAGIGSYGAMTGNLSLSMERAVLSLRGAVLEGTGIQEEATKEHSATEIAQTEDSVQVLGTESRVVGTDILIAPDSVLTAEEVSRIRESLSDDVTIIEDPEHPDTGVIIPQFKDGDGEPYRFLTLPDLDLES